MSGRTILFMTGVGKVGRPGAQGKPSKTSAPLVPWLGQRFSGPTAPAAAVPSPVKSCWAGSKCSQLGNGEPSSMVACNETGPPLGCAMTFCASCNSKGDST